ALLELLAQRARELVVRRKARELGPVRIGRRWRAATRQPGGGQLVEAAGHGQLARERVARQGDVRKLVAIAEKRNPAAIHEDVPSIRERERRQYFVTHVPLEEAVVE